MSIESMEDALQAHQPEDVNAARELFEENEELRNDPRSKKAMETGLDSEGKPVKDLGNFLAGRLEDIKNKKSGLTGEPLTREKYEATRVINSVRPDRENDLEN